ncbi:MAG: ABC transporter permease [Azospirillaceae bacterium]
MLNYVVRRLMVMIPTLFAISAISFFIIQLPPGDFLTTLINEQLSRGEGADMSNIERLRQTYGLDRSLVEQYFVWLFNALQGDFGWSFEYELPVTTVVGDRMTLTVLVNVATIVFIWIVAFPIGVYAATHQYSAGDYALTFLGFLGFAIPNFLLAIIIMYYSNVWFGTDIGGLMDREYIDQPMSWGKFVSVLEHLIAPVVVIGTAGTAAMIRRLRANLLDELQKQYYITALAKGLPRRRALIKYPLRSALNPFIADIGGILPDLISGSTIVSVVLSLQTIGPLFLSALQSQDMYLAGSMVFWLAILTVIGVLISDLLLAVLDPRIRLGGAAVK